MEAARGSNPLDGSITHGGQSCPGGQGRKSPKLIPVGKTEDGKLVVKGLFRLVDTYGLPLEVAVHHLNEQGLMPSWLEFWRMAGKSGWKPSSTYQKLLVVVSDVYGPEFRDEWENRMGSLLAESPPI